MAAQAVNTPVRKTAADNLLAAPGKLCWLTVDNPTGGALTVKLNDATSGTASDVFQVTVPTNDVRHLVFDPPCPFATGIRLGTLADGLIVTGGFIAD